MDGKAEQWVIVTGASGGVGMAIAHELSGAGYGIVALARSRQKLNDLDRDLRAKGGSCLPIACDVSDPSNLKSVAIAIQSRDLTVVGLVNNAGTIEPIAPLVKADPDQWANNITVNLISVQACIHAFAPFLTAPNGSVIVNISSGAAQRPLEGWSAYCASKAGLAMLTRSLHHEAADQFLAYGFQPGLVDTQMQEKIRQSGINPVSARPRESLLPPSDPAQIVAWLFRERPEDLRGTEFRADDNTIRERAGLKRL